VVSTLLKGRKDKTKWRGENQSRASQRIEIQMKKKGTKEKMQRYVQ
jgi:hypothetical protein